MKQEYTLLKRSKVDVNRFAFVCDGTVVANFTAGQLFVTMQKLKHADAIKNVDVLWRDGTRTVEELRVVEQRRFIQFDTLEYEHSICLLLRAQGLPVELSVPVDVRKLFDKQGPFITEIRVPSELVADLHPALERFIPDEDDDMDEDFDEDDEAEDLNDTDFGFRPEDIRRQLGDFNYRSPDWVVTMTDAQVDEVNHLEVGIDPDIELPRAADAKDEFF